MGVNHPTGGGLKCGYHTHTFHIKPRVNLGAKVCSSRTELRAFVKATSFFCSVKELFLSHVHKFDSMIDWYHHSNLSRLSQSLTNQLSHLYHNRPTHPYQMTTVSEIVRLIDHYDLPEEVLELILKQVYRWTPPRVDDKGYVVSKVKNIHMCPTSLVSDNVVDRHRWQHIATVPALHAYERRVCLWKSEYYDTPPATGGKYIGRYRGRNVFQSQSPTTLSSVTGITRWVRLEGLGYPLLKGVDRRSEEWIGYKSWLHTHPTFRKHTFRWERKNSKVLTDHWFKYELALAYPTLYGKRGWANNK